MSENNNTYKTLSSCLMAILLVPVGTVYLYIVNGFVFSQLWGWFVVNTFHLQPLTLIQAIGMGMMIGFLTRTNVNWSEVTKKKTTTENFLNIFYSYVGPWITWFAGWIVYTFWFAK